MAEQKQTETDWRTVHRRHNKDMLFFEDLGGKTRVDVEIVESGTILVQNKRGKEPMPWIAFRGKQGTSKKLGLNKTNCKVMTKLFGTRIIERWRGWITLLVIETRVKDEDTGEWVTTDAIRIAPKRPDPPAAKGQQTSSPAATPAPTAEPPTKPAPPPAAGETIVPRADEDDDTSTDVGPDEAADIQRSEREANR